MKYPFIFMAILLIVSSLCFLIYMDWAGYTPNEAEKVATYVEEKYDESFVPINSNPENLSRETENSTQYWLSQETKPGTVFYAEKNKKTGEIKDNYILTTVQENFAQELSSLSDGQAFVKIANEDGILTEQRGVPYMSVQEFINLNPEYNKVAFSISLSQTISQEEALLVASNIKKNLDRYSFIYTGVISVPPTEGYPSNINITSFDGTWRYGAMYRGIGMGYSFSPDGIPVKMGSDW